MKRFLTIFLTVLPAAALTLDINGNGTPGTVEITADSISVNDGKMTGKFPRPPGLANDAGFRFADLNGDGLADLLYADQSRAEAPGRCRPSDPPQ